MPVYPWAFRHGWLRPVYLSVTTSRETRSFLQTSFRSSRKQTLNHGGTVVQDVPNASTQCHCLSRRGLARSLRDQSRKQSARCGLVVGKKTGKEPCFGKFGRFTRHDFAEVPVSRFLNSRKMIAYGPCHTVCLIASGSTLGHSSLLPLFCIYSVEGGIVIAKAHEVPSMNALCLIITYGRLWQASRSRGVIAGGRLCIPSATSYGSCSEVRLAVFHWRTRLDLRVPANIINARSFCQPDILDWAIVEKVHSVMHVFMHDKCNMYVM